MDNDKTNLSVKQLVGVLRRRVPLIALCFVLAAAAAYGFSSHQTKKYTATASLVFSNNQLGQQVAGLPVANSNNQQAQQNTNLKLVQLGDMATKTAGLLGRGLTKESVMADLSVTAQGESNIVDVAATATSPVLAADLANAYTELFVAEQQNSNHAYYASALSLVNKQLAALSPQARAGTAGLALQERAQSLGTLAELRNGNVQVAQPAAVPTSPSSPKVSRNTILGAFFGLLLGVGAAFLLERSDPRIREPEDLEAVYGLPLLGVVPESAALSPAGRRGGKPEGVLPPGETEAFHLIRAHLRYFNVDRTLRTLVIASAGPGDGKTTVALHLASAAARMGSRVMLIEADLRRPTLVRRLEVQSGLGGLADVLIGDVLLNEAIQPVGLTSASEGWKERAFDVLLAGSQPPPNPGELMESEAMELVLDFAKAEYDLVVIDTPPLTAVSDAFPLLRKVDGVVIVGRLGRNRRDVAERLRDTLVGTGAPLLGVVANGFKVRRRGSNSYGYGYEYVASGPGGESAPHSQEEEPSSGQPVSSGREGSLGSH
jgi:succinoglycan biosynthesis transport protein ExoP